MAPDERRFSIPARVGAGVCVWAVVVFAAWAIQPIDDVATFAPVDAPTAAEQASIDAVFGEVDGPQPKLFEEVTCDSSPLGVATGTSRSADAPSLEPGFEYTNSPCSDAYDAATAAFWVNLLVIVVALAACALVRFRRTDDPDDGSPGGGAPGGDEPVADVLLTS